MAITQRFFQPGDYAVFVVLLVSSGLFGVVLGIIDYCKNRRKAAAGGEGSEADENAEAKVQQRNLSGKYANRKINKI